MININYNLKRHIELLKQEKKILNEKKSFLKENPKEALELIKYGAKVSQHIVWEDRFEIASVMEDFLSKKINAHEFHDSVFGLRRKHSEKCKRFLSKLVSEEIKDICLDSQTHILSDKSYTHNCKTPISIYENQNMSKSGKSSAIIAFDENSGDMITLGKRGKKYMNQVKESGNMGTGGGTL